MNNVKKIFTRIILQYLMKEMIVGMTDAIAENKLDAPWIEIV